MFIGSGRSVRSVSKAQLLGIGEFSEDVNYSAGDLVMYNNQIYRFTADHSGAWSSADVVAVNVSDLFLAGVGDPRIKVATESNLTVGAMLFYDRMLEVYCVVAPEMIEAVLADYDSTRYETNFDCYIGTAGSLARFVAKTDAMPSQSLYDNTVAATACYYRIEIDNTNAGSITFSATSGNGSIAETTISWAANEAMSTIVGKFTAKNASYLTFASLADGSGVGLLAGGYGANTMTVTASTSCTVIDCSGFAFYRSHNPAAPAVGGTFNPAAAYTFIGQGVHHNFRGAAAASILTGKGLVAANSSCIANDGFNYSYRTGINYAKFLSWATSSGDDTYYDDGEGGTDDSVGHVMRKSRFDTEVTNYTGSDAHRLGMKEYYTHLLNDQTGDYAAMREEYEGRYGAKMLSMYDGYIMSHMIKLDAASGITYTMLGKGKNQTDVKADCMNVTYDYVIIPAYPPEYNAHTYGIADSEGFKPGNYYHPEPVDVGMFLQDDIMAEVNASLAETGVTGELALDNSTYRGSSADSYGGYTWYFYGSSGCFDGSTRYSGIFRSRPVLALSLS